MKVMLPVKNEKAGKDELAEGFHNIDYLCIYDSLLKTTEWISAKDISEIPGGLNTALIQKEIYTIISKNITPMVLAMFNRNGIIVYKAQSLNVSKNLELFQSNQLEPFTALVSRLNFASCSSSCSSCNSSCN